MGTETEFQIISNEGAHMIQTKQNQAQQIVLNEIDRLKMKKSNMDTERNNAERMILLNQSFRDRQQQYLMIMFIFLSVFGISLAIVFFQQKLGITTVFMDILLIIVVGIGIFAAVFMFYDIFSRDSLDFSQLKQDGGRLTNSILKKEDANAAANKAALTSGAVTQAMGTTCKGADCCGPGFRWDNAATNKCIAVP
jgi:hypothetical protein